MSAFATLLHGEAAEVAELLDGRDFTPSELRAALTNAMRRIASLEQQAQSAQLQVEYVCNLTKFLGGPV
jgi:hypothetical protein